MNVVEKILQFQGKFAQSTALKMIRQFYFVYPQIQQTLSDKLKIAIKIHQSVTDKN
jgi:hypothetical protein